MEEPRAAQLLAQVGDERPRERRGAVLAALARADGEFASGQVEVQHAEAQALGEPQAGAVEERRDQPALAVVAVELVEDGADLLPAQDDRQAGLLAGADQLVELAHLAVQHVAVEEEERAERLGLRRGADVLVDGQVRDEGVDLGLRHVGRVAEPVEADVPPHPQAVGLLGAAAVVARPQGALQLVDQRGHRPSLARRRPGSRGDRERHPGGARAGARPGRGLPRTRAANHPFRVRRRRQGRATFSGTHRRIGKARERRDPWNAGPWSRRSPSSCRWRHSRRPGRTSRRRPPPRRRPASRSRRPPSRSSGRRRARRSRAAELWPSPPAA